MDNKRCKLFIAIEGGDGAGKATQAALLKAALGPDAEVLHFPMYGTPGCKGVEDFLSGKMGSPDSLSPYFLSTLFAQDRRDSYKNDWEKLYHDPSKIIIADRYTQSNILYQGSRCAVKDGKLDIEALWAYIGWQSNMEYQNMGLPAPDVTLWLDVKPDVTKQLREGRPSKRPDGETKDVLEESTSAQDAAYLVGKFLSIVQHNFIPVNCVKGRKNFAIRPQEDIHNRIMKALAPYLESCGIAKAA